eukprot:scaffold152046_cov55-Attheya_sp.AAC.7
MNWLHVPDIIDGQAQYGHSISSSSMKCQCQAWNHFVDFGWTSSVSQTQALSQDGVVSTPVIKNGSLMDIALLAMKAGGGMLFELERGSKHLTLSLYEGCRLRADALQKSKIMAFLECPNLHWSEKTGKVAVIAIWLWPLEKYYSDAPFSTMQADTHPSMMLDHAGDDIYFIRLNPLECLESPDTNFCQSLREMQTFVVPHLCKEKGTFGMLEKMKVDEILEGSDTKHEHDVKDEGWEVPDKITSWKLPGCNEKTSKKTMSLRLNSRMSQKEMKTLCNR